MIGDTQSTVRSIVGELLEEDLEAAGDVRRKDHPKWDSVKHVQIVITVEDTFGVDLSECGLGELDSLDGLVRAVSARTS